MNDLYKYISKDKRRKSIIIRCSEEEFKKITKKADKFTAGNISEWLRYAGTTHELRRKDSKDHMRRSRTDSDFDVVRVSRGAKKSE